MRLWALAEDGRRRELEMEQLWPHKGGLILKFASVDSMSEAETLVGCELQVPRAQRAQLDPGWTYVSDLIGCSVFDGERRIGVVQDVRFGAGEAPLLLVRGEKDYEIPFAEAYLQQVDAAGKQIRMQLPEGMLDVNAPLSEEEKQRQQKPN
jgi:16S rRNA processing protein RimM